MSEPIIVTGVIDLDPANHDAAVDALTTCMMASRDDEGCEGYVFSSDLVDPGRFHTFELWASLEAMEAHMATPHMATLMTQMGELGVTGASLTKWAGATASKLM